MASNCYPICECEFRNVIGIGKFSVIVCGHVHILEAESDRHLSVEQVMRYQAQKASPWGFVHISVYFICTFDSHCCTCLIKVYVGTASFPNENQQHIEGRTEDFKLPVALFLIFSFPPRS